MLYMSIDCIKWVPSYNPHERGNSIESRPNNWAYDKSNKEIENHLSWQIAVRSFTPIKKAQCLKNVVGVPKVTGRLCHMIRSVEEDTATGMIDAGYITYLQFPWRNGLLTKGPDDADDNRLPTGPRKASLQNLNPSTPVEHRGKI